MFALLKIFIFSVNLFVNKCIYLNNTNKHCWSYNFQIKIVRKYSQKTLNEIWKIQCIYFLNINSILCRKLLLFFKNTSGQKITHVTSVYWKTLVFEKNQLELHHIHLWICLLVSRWTCCPYHQIPVGHGKFGVRSKYSGI